MTRTLEDAEKDIASLQTWVPKCKNCGRAITRIDLPAPEGYDMKGVHGWLHVAPTGVFCPPYQDEDEHLCQPTVEPEDSPVCRMWATLDQQRAKAEAMVYELRKHIKDLEADPAVRPRCTRCVEQGKLDPQPAAICQGHFDIMELGYETAQGELDRLRAARQ